MANAQVAAFGIDEANLFLVSSGTGLVAVIPPLRGIWYINFAGIASHAVMPYDQYLRYLPAYIQQFEIGE